MLSEHKYLEEHVFRLDAKNAEVSCFGIAHQCHLALMRNEKKENWEKEVSQHNELLIDYQQKKKIYSSW